MVKELPEDMQEDAKKLDNVIKMPTSTLFETNKDGDLKANSYNNVKKLILEDDLLKDVFAYNLFTQSVAVVKSVPELDITAGAYRDIYTDILMDRFETNHHVAFKTDVFMRGLRQASFQQRFNPVLDRINAVEWDGVKRAETLFIDFLGTKDNHYIREVTRKWLVGAVARAIKPAIKFELMPVLIGSQGIGKSTLCGALCPDYFLDNLPSLSGVNKDNLMLIKDSWIVEVAELSAMSKTAIEGTKAFISTRVDKYKAPYASTVEDHPRRCVFIGTTNESEFLKDKTGNRRFLPVECGVEKPTKDVFNISDGYILQVLAEAKVLFENGEDLFLDEDTKAELEEVQKDNIIQDPLEDVIDEYLNMYVPYDWEEYTSFQKHNYYIRYYGNSEITDRKNNVVHKEDMEKVDKVTNKEINQAVLKIEGEKVVNASKGGYNKKISFILNANKDFEKARFRRDGLVVRGWKRK